MKKYWVGIFILLVCLLVVTLYQSDSLPKYNLLMTEKTSPVTTEAPQTQTPEPTAQPPVTTATPIKGEETVYDISKAGSKTTAYSRSFSISRGMTVTHPLTGKQVNLDSYAKAKGYNLSNYYGKNIVCGIYESYDESGKKSMYLSVICGGSTLYHTSITSEDEKQNYITLINTYLP